MAGFLFGFEAGTRSWVWRGRFQRTVRGTAMAARICAPKVLRMTSSGDQGYWIDVRGMKAVSHWMLERVAWWPVLK